MEWGFTKYRAVLVGSVLMVVEDWRVWDPKGLWSTVGEYWKVSGASPSSQKRNQGIKAIRFANACNLMIENQAATRMSSNAETKWSVVKLGGSRTEQPLSLGW